MRKKFGKSNLAFAALLFASIICAPAALAQNVAPAVPVGQVKGSAWVHTERSLKDVAQDADVVLPASVNGGKVFVGKLRDVPSVPSVPSTASGGKVPVVLFMHGSSGLALKAIAEWQLWLASFGVASVAPNSFALPERVTYSSPIDKDSYEKIHALRSSEIAPTLAALKGFSWVDLNRLVLAGASEGGVPVARYEEKEFAAKMIFSWSCEMNYFVKTPLNNFEMDKPVLNVMSTVDPFFSSANPWLGAEQARGHCGDALKGHTRSEIVLIPSAPHTLINLPQARAAVRSFIERLR